MDRVKTQRTGGIIENVAKYSGAALGVLAGLDVAVAAETVLGKALMITLGGVAGAWFGEKIGKAPV